MCGIAGIFSTQLDKSQLEKRISSMQRSLRHRGPDDQGSYVSAAAPIALAHTRLSILDLSPAGHQPMSSPDGRYWITFNGEIYNFQALRTQLEAKGEAFYTQTDTEVILRLYHHYGEACVQQMRGMFAFAIWDQQMQRGFIARDPLGIKPLYYWQSGSQLVFASELRSLMASGLPARELSPEGLYGYLVSGSVPEPYTLVEGVRCLPAGSHLHWQDGEVKEQLYWTVRFGVDKSTVEEAGDRTRSALLDSVKAHYTSDVPVGVFLSGGIDSTAIVALSRQAYQGPLRTYSIALEDPDWNEGDLAKRVSQTFNTEHVEHVLTAAEGQALFPDFLKVLDQPTIDGFNSFCVSQVAHRHGQKVVLSGLGGDELFGGYKSFKTLPNLLGWGHWAKRVKIPGSPIANYLSQSGSSGKWRRFGDYLQQPTSLPRAYQSFRGIFSHSEALSLLQHFMPGVTFSPSLHSHTLSSQPSLADSISELELSQYMRNQLLRDSDVMSMACGLELRVPFVDRLLLEEISTIPSTQRLAYGKQLLVKAVPEVPEWIVNRPKRGFQFPFDEWFSQGLGDPIKDSTFPKEITMTRWYRRWSVTVLQYWLQEVFS
ncbi:MAG: asparagine synthase (glutamine-hydrolyzing) [Phormidesmis sp.]